MVTAPFHSKSSFANIQTLHVYTAIKRTGLQVP